MENVLKNFEQLCTAHSLQLEVVEGMRKLLNDAHTAGYAKHMAVVSDTDADEEQDSMPGRSAEPDEPEDEEEATERMVKAVRKAVKKEVRKVLRAQKKSMRKEVRNIVSGLAAVRPGAAALVG